MADTEDLVDALTVNLPQLNWAAKIRGQRTPSILPVPRGMLKQNLSLDPTSSDDIQAWAARNIPQFPIEPGAYGSQLAKDVEREFVPSASDTEDQTSYKALKGLFGLSMGGGGGAPGTLAAVKAKGGMWHPNAHEMLSEQLTNRHPQDAPTVTSDWAEKAVKNYLNKHAGTEADPLKNLEIPYGAGQGTVRWEQITDSMIHSKPMSQLEISKMSPQLFEAWRAGKVKSDEPVWNIDNNLQRGITKEYNDWLERNDLPKLSMDELHPEGGNHGPERGWKEYEALTQQQRNELLDFGERWSLAEEEGQNPVTSYMAHTGDYLRGVPPDQLQRYDLVRAVQETARADAARAKKMNSAEGRSEGTTLMKEYPDKFRWIEVGKSPLETPEQLAKEGYEVRHMPSDIFSQYPYRSFHKGQEVLQSEMGSARPEQAWKMIAEERQAQRAKDALNNEGQVMGHCVGSYCDMVNEGETKIFSLRDPKGQSHVTIEVRPSRIAGKLAVLDFGELPVHLKHHAEQLVQKAGKAESAAHAVLTDPKILEFLDTVPPTIEQIKGKQNRSPEEKYHPYVQDFVKGGKWGDANELEGVGLTKWKGGYATGPELKLELDQRLLNYTLPDTKEGLFHRKHTTLDSAIATYRGGGHRAPSDMKRILREIDRLYTGSSYATRNEHIVDVSNVYDGPTRHGYRDLNPEELLALRRKYGFND